MNFVAKHKLNLQAVAANVGYEFSSRGTIGRATAPEPQTYKEAVNQLLQDKHERSAKTSERVSSVTADVPEDVRKKLDTFLAYIELDTVLRNDKRVMKLLQEDIQEEDMEAFGDIDDATLERLKNKRDRTKHEDQRYKTLMKLRFIKTRTMRSQARRLKCVQDDSEKIESIMNQQQLNTAPMDNKLPDFKLKQIQAYFTEEPGRQMNSPYCLVTNPALTEEEFMKKFKENPGFQDTEKEKEGA